MRAAARQGWQNSPHLQPSRKIFKKKSSQNNVKGKINKQDKNVVERVIVLFFLSK